MAVALIGAAVALLLTLEHALVRSRDDAAQARVRDLATLARASALPQPLPIAHEEDFAQVVDGAGDVVAASATVGGRPAVTTFAPAGPDPAVRTVSAVAEGTEREEYRVWALPIDTAEGPRVVYVGYSVESVTETIEALRDALIVGLPVPWTDVSRCHPPTTRLDGWRRR